VVAEECQVVVVAMEMEMEMEMEMMRVLIEARLKVVSPKSAT
jgi:hypothetical protein